MVIDPSAAVTSTTDPEMTSPPSVAEPEEIVNDEFRSTVPLICVFVADVTVSDSRSSVPVDPTLFNVTLPVPAVRVSDSAVVPAVPVSEPVI